MPAPLVLPNDRGHGRDHSFTIEQFEHLVSTALDAQALPDSALSFSFGGNTYPPSCNSPRSTHSKDRSRRKTGTFARLKDAFVRKQGASDISFTMPPETRRFASSSAPALSSSPQANAASTSTSCVSLELGRNQFHIHSKSSTSTGPVPFTPPPLPSPRFSNAAVNHAIDKDPSSPGIFPQRDRSHSSTRSFLNLKPLTIPKLTKQSSGRPLPSDSLPTPPEAFDAIRSTPVVSEDFTHAENEGLRSFFDDSGFEEELRVPNVLRKKSKSSFRSFFSSATSDGLASSRSGYKHDKAQPSVPDAISKPVRTRRRKSSRAEELSLIQSPVTDDGSSLFYSPPATAQSLTEGHPAFEWGDSRMASDTASTRRSKRLTNWITRSTSSTPHKVEALIRNYPPAYPSPTSPLPPTPSLPTSQLPDKVLHKPSHVHGTVGVGRTIENSIDPTELLSWRMPSLKQQVSRTSTTSSAQAHALGRPSRGSIRERLGLGPRLQLHVPLPSQFIAEATKKKLDNGDYFLRGSTSSRSRNAAPYGAHPLSGRPSTSASMPITKLASASLVSLRSIATVTAKSRGSCGDNEFGYHKEDVLDVDRAFTTEDDPFAADPLTPITPLTPLSPAIQEPVTKCRSFMQLENDTLALAGSPATPISAPASLPSWHYRLGSSSNVSSPALASSSTIRRAIPSLNETKRSESPASIRSGMPASLVDPLNSHPRSPSVLLYPLVSRRKLRRVISRVRKSQNNSGEHRTSDSSGQERNASSIAGHTESRPHSPFPMLALRPSIAKSVPDITWESRRSSTASFVWDGTDEQNQDRPGANSAHPINHEQHSLEHAVSSCAEAADAFHEVANNVPSELPRRDLLSPTAWLLDSDEYDDFEKQAVEVEMLANRSNKLGLDIASCDRERSRCDVGNVDDKESQARSRTTVMVDMQYTSPSRFSRPDFEIESETEAEGDITVLHSSQIWPLPPHCTVVVDEETGEGYHAVEPVVEFVQAGSVAHSPRHSIRFPKRRSDPTSIGSHSSRRSNGSPSLARKLNSSQTRLITEQFGHASGGDTYANAASSPSMGISRVLQAHQLKERTRSATSLASASAQSHETSKTSFYSARSTDSRSSNRSTFSFTHPHQVRKHSREGSSYSSCSRSPPGSADHHSKLALKSIGNAVATKSSVLDARGSAY